MDAFDDTVGEKNSARKDTFEVNNVQTQKKTRVSAMKFNVAEVARPFASAVRVVEAGNIMVMHPDDAKCYIQNVNTGERMRIRKHKGAFVFDVEYEGGSEGMITLDSGAGVNVIPRGTCKTSPTLPRKEGLRMIAASGTEIKNYGVKTMEFKAGARRRMCSMKFNVSDVSKPLAAVSAMVAAGSRVVFEKRGKRSYVENLSIG